MLFIFWTVQELLNFDKALFSFIRHPKQKQISALFLL